MLRIDNFGQLAITNHFFIHPHLDLVLKAIILLGILANDNGKSRSPMFKIYYIPTSFHFQ